LNSNLLLNLFSLLVLGNNFLKQIKKKRAIIEVTNKIKIEYSGTRRIAFQSIVNLSFFLTLKCYLVFFA